MDQPPPLTPTRPTTPSRRRSAAFSPRFSTISVRGDVGGDANENRTERRRSSAGGGEERRRRSSSGGAARATPFGTIYAGDTPPKTLKECLTSALEHETAKATMDKLSREVGPSAKRPPAKKKPSKIADVTNTKTRPKQLSDAPTMPR